MMNNRTINNPETTLLASLMNQGRVEQPIAIVPANKVNAKNRCHQLSNRDSLAKAFEATKISLVDRTALNRWREIGCNPIMARAPVFAIHFYGEGKATREYHHQRRANTHCLLDADDILEMLPITIPKTAFPEANDRRTAVFLSNFNKLTIL